MEASKNKWAIRQSFAVLCAGFVAFITLSFQIYQHIYQYTVKPEQAIELSIEPKQLKGLKLQNDDHSFYLDITVKAKNVGARDFTMCFEDPIEGLESNCDPQALSAKQSKEYIQDEAKELQAHKQEILVDNDLAELERLRKGEISMDKAKEVQFDNMVTTLQKESTEETPQHAGFKRPRMSPINVVRVMATVPLLRKQSNSLPPKDSALSPEFTLGEPTSVDFWKEDKGMRPLKGFDIRAGQTETLRALVSVPCPGLYRIGFAVRFPKDEAGRVNLVPAQDPIWSTSEFFVVEGSQNVDSHCIARDDGRKDTAKKTAKLARSVKIN